MELEDYKEKLQQLEKEFKITKDNLAIQYAQANNPYQIGDIISDGGCIIEINKIVTYLNYTKPCCVYKGRLLKKDLTPTKKFIIDSIYQHHPITKLERKIK